MRYAVVIEKAGENYSAYVPDLPGCVAAARSVEKVRKLITKAIALHLDLMRQSGEPLPSPTRQIDFVVDETAEEEFCTWVEVKPPEPVSS